MTEIEQLTRAARALVDESAVEMTTGDGAVVEIWTIASDGDAVRASGPRLEVREGMTLECRLVIEGLPHRVEAVIEQADIQSLSRAALIVRVTGVAVDGQRRRHKRVEASVGATLTALVCDRMVPGETVAAVIDDISPGGLALSIADLGPRAGDRMRVRVRIFEGTIDCELRVTSARIGDNPATQVIGAAFITPGAETEATIAALIERLEVGRPAMAGTHDLRAALGLGPAPASASPAPRTAPGFAPGLASA